MDLESLKKLRHNLFVEDLDAVDQDDLNKKGISPAKVIRNKNYEKSLMAMKEVS